MCAPTIQQNAGFSHTTINTSLTKQITELQEVGGNHGVALWGRSSNGFGAMPGMDNLFFVATRMQIRMDSYPKW